MQILKHFINITVANALATEGFITYSTYYNKWLDKNDQFTTTVERAMTPEFNFKLMGD